MNFANPDLLAAAVILPAVILALGFLDDWRRRSLVARLGDVPLVQRMMASASTWRRWTKRVLFATAIALISIAAARPQLLGGRDDSESGLDVVLAVDVSKSMLVDDVEGRRLGRARELVTALAPSLANDRVGAVVFAGTAAHFPLTDDIDVALQFLRDIGPIDLPGGSSLEEAIRVGACLLRPEANDAWGSRCGDTRGRGHGGDPLPGEVEDTPRGEEVEEKSDRSKVLVLFTDGAEGETWSTLEEQVEQAKTLGITIVTVGIGTRRGGPVPDVDERGEPSGAKIDEDGVPVTSALDADGLRALAGLGGNVDRFVEVGPGAVDPVPISAILQGLTRGTLQKTSRRVVNEQYAPFLFAGFMLLVIEACLGTRRRIKYPEG